ncbi:MAG: Ni/Fe-hydrogenase, b-type cytochrome subunit [Candidatus Zixiibacteriota bacterium]|nr:MAG: Ni/Fe-hydrogenase, b-type cytochrome subunit [candidate division Zixibacteria bacterium]
MARRVHPINIIDVARSPHRYFRRKYVWQWPVRIFHWVNAVAVTVLFSTGLYISHPILAPAGEPFNNFVMATVRQVHFIFAFIFLINFLWRIYWFWFGNNYARSGFPFFWRRSWWKDLFRQVGDYFSLKRGHVHLGHNALAGLSYTIFVIGLGWVQIFTGLALYSESNPGGFWSKLTGWVIPLLGGSMQTHMWHHLFAWGFIVFAILHVYIVFYDGQQYKNGLVTSMISGVKFYRNGDLENDKWLS